MNRQTFQFELITPCFCGGADPNQQAEIRPTSIRGQLRWWFRVLGGLKSGLTESTIFGSTAGDNGNAGLLRLAVTQPVISKPTDRKNAEDLNAGMGTDLGYALFPLRSFQGHDGKRGCLPEGTLFSLSLTWLGNRQHWSDILALLSVWSHLGSLGFRSRRTVGAIRMTSSAISVQEAVSFFNQFPTLKKISCNANNTWRSTSEALLMWYRSCRQHGQSKGSWRWIDKKDKSKGAQWVPANANAFNEIKKGSYFGYARRDHNEGLAALGKPVTGTDPLNPKGENGQVFRPALGVPIIQKFSSIGDEKKGPGTKRESEVNWEFSPYGGRFASPVLLRPHKDGNDHWHALVIFVDSQTWPVGHHVYLNGQPRQVAPDLYNAMKADKRLSPFP